MGVLSGIRVIELAQYIFVPSATSVLAEWGADVIKIEPPVGGDAIRGMTRTGDRDLSGSVNFVIEHALGGGVTANLSQDLHGKSLSALMLTIALPDRT